MKNTSILSLAMILLLLLDPGRSRAQQDLYNYENSIRFTEYLMAAEDYKSAARELERLAFLFPQRDSLKLNLLQAYRKAGDYEMGIRRYREFQTEQMKAIEELKEEYTRLLLLSGHYADAQAFIDRELKEDRGSYRLSLLLLQKDWDSAYAFATRQEGQYPLLSVYATRGVNTRYKSPALAAGLSAVVPGLGKVYSGRWKDGVIAFLFVGANAFAAYRGFDKNGAGSAFGWIFTTLGTAYYAGNIYGSYMAAKEYNEKSENDIKYEVENYLLHSD